MATDDHSLILDRRAELKGAPAAHVLVVGISRYTYLPMSSEGGINSEFVPIDFAARSALFFADWIRHNSDKLATPLGTCRVLLAPSDKEVEDLHHSGVQPEPCDVNSFLTAATAWRRDGLENRDGVMVLYFAGHSLELTQEQPALVFQDFGNGIGPTFRATVSLPNLVDGLTPSDWQPNIARKQFFFIDTDRIAAKTVQTEFTLGPDVPLFSTDVFDVPRLRSFDDRRCLVLYATPPGGQAYAEPSNRTFFNAALIKCLDGDGAVAAPPDSEGSTTWRVTGRSLVHSMQVTLDRLLDGPGYQRIAWSIRGQDAVLVRIERTPQVELKIRIEPPTLSSKAKIEIYDDVSRLIAIVSPTSEVNTVTIPAGMCRVQISVIEHAQPVFTKLIFAAPPVTELIARFES